MIALKELLISIFIGKKNRKYLGKYLLMIIVLNVLRNLIADFIRGDEVSFMLAVEYLIITTVIMFVLFRLWIKIYEGTQVFWEKVLG